MRRVIEPEPAKRNPAYVLGKANEETTPGFSLWKKSELAVSKSAV